MRPNSIRSLCAALLSTLGLVSLTHAAINLKIDDKRE